MTQPPEVPIVPGGHPPTLSALMPAPVPSPPRRHRWLAWAIPGLAVAVAVGVAAEVFGPQLLDDEAPATPTATALAAASEQCGAGQLSDADKTLVLDMVGQERGPGLAPERVMCVLDALKVPEYVRAEMQKTRALDGRRSQSWTGFEVSWTYHPDDGLDVIVRQVQ